MKSGSSDIKCPTTHHHGAYPDVRLKTGGMYRMLYGHQAITHAVGAESRSYLVTELASGPYWERLLDLGESSYEAGRERSRTLPESSSRSTCLRLSRSPRRGALWASFWPGFGGQ